MPNTVVREQENDVHQNTLTPEPADPDIQSAESGLDLPEYQRIQSMKALPATEGDEPLLLPEGTLLPPDPADSSVELMLSYEPGTATIVDAAIRIESETGTTVLPSAASTVFTAPAERKTEPAQALSQEDDEDDQEWIHGDLDADDDEIDDNVNDTSSVAFLRREEQLNAPDPTPVEVVRSNFTVIAAVAAGVIVSCVKFLASYFTGSVAMLSEGIHSLVDACNDSLLLLGTRASKKKPDIEHPFGFGREVYFYTFVVSVVIFFFGGGFTVYQGVRSFIAGGNVVENPIVNYIVLGIGIFFEGFSWSVAWRDVKKSRNGRRLIDYIRDSTSPTKFTVLLEDTAAELGMVIAMLGIFFSLLLDMPRLDSLASILIGLLMATIAVVLLRETRSLLIGEGLTREEIEDVVYIVERDPSVIKCGRVMSMYMGPNDMLLTLDVTFDDELDEGDVLQAIDRIEEELVDDFPQCTSIFVEVESLNQVYRQRHDRKQQFEAEEEDAEDEERERELERERALAKAKKKAKAKAKAKKKKKKAKAKAAQRVAAAAAAASVEAEQQMHDHVDVSLDEADSEQDDTPND